MKLRSVLFLLALGLTALDWSVALPVEIVDLDRLRTSLVDSTKAGEIFDEGDSNSDDSSDGK